MSRARGVRAKTILAACIALALTAAPATASYKVIHTWGTPGTSGGQLEAPLEVVAVLALRQPGDQRFLVPAGEVRLQAGPLDERTQSGEDGGARAGAV